MGYLDNSSITVDAILTKKGRELLSKGQEQFRITQFALADDEIDYDLWNPAHPLGTAYYGIIIENMPLVEAFSDESQMMRYKLVTLPRDTARIPVLTGVPAADTFKRPNEQRTYRPQTSNATNANATLGYTAILSNNKLGTLVAPVQAPSSVSATVPRFIGDAENAQTVSVTGLEFVFTANGDSISDQTGTITFIANETGGSITTTITIKRTSLENAIGTSLSQNFSG